MRVAAYILKIRFLQVAGAPSCLRFRESCFPNGASGTYSSRFNALSHSAPRTSHQTTYSETKGQIRYQDQTEICSRCSSIYCRARRPLATNHPTTLARRSARCQPKDRALTNYSRQDYGVRCRRHRRVLVPEPRPKRKTTTRRQASKMSRTARCILASMTTTSPPRKHKPANMLGDWDDVRFFLAVARTGSFSAAAVQLNTKQTTVGRRIQALERRLGAKLFDRHRHGMEVTPAARGVLVQAESMLSNATSIERHLAGLDREMAGVVRIAATEGIAAHWLVPRLDQLRRSHPDIVVQVIAGDQVLDLATRQADLAIRFFRPTSNQLVAARVGQFNMSIFASPNYIAHYGLPQKLEDMREPNIVDHTTLHSLPAMKPWSE